MIDRGGVVALLSGGLDSSVNVYWLLQRLQDPKLIHALTINYGQRALHAEIRTAKTICDQLKISHTTVDIPFLGQFSSSALTDKAQKIPQANEVSIDDLKVSAKTASSVWVSNRNGVMIAIAAALAESLKFQYVLVGFNKEEAATFPDNRPEFIEASNQALRYSTSNAVEVICFTSEMTKTDIVKQGRALKVPFKKLWPCYFDGITPCGSCESCQRFERALNHSE